MYICGIEWGQTKEGSKFRRRVIRGRREFRGGYPLQKVKKGPQGVLSTKRRNPSIPVGDFLT